MSDTAASIPATLRATAARYPEQEAIVDGAVRLTYRELDRAVLDACRALIGMGVHEGDRVAVWAQNCWQWCVVELAVLAARAVAVPINTRFRGKEAAELLDNSRAVALFTTSGFLDVDYAAMLRQAAPSHADLPIVVMSGEVSEKDITWEQFLEHGTTVPEEDALKRVADLRADEISDIMYTSGTTGVPKGVIQTHGKNLLAMKALGAALGFRPGDRNLVLAPLFAQFGMRAGLYMGLMHAAATILESAFDPDAIIDLVERERVTVLPGPPTILAAFLTPKARQRDLSSLRIALTGSTVIPEELVIGLLENNIFDNVLTAYGLTEACGPVSVSSLQDSPATVSQYAGRVLEHLEFRVVDAEGRTMSAGEQGEFLVRGPTVMSGYLNDPEQSAKAVNPEGWLHTGDVGLVDPGGYVKVTGRLKDMFIVGGFNVYPAEVENSIREHEGVREVALVGIPDERLGEVGAAFIVCERGYEFDETALREWCRSALANFKVPRMFLRTEELPLNSSLKVDKKVLAERALEMCRARAGQAG
ncbi:AMP-binding protein [Amycolatopsis methanolica]|uniref:Long-chain-fatty-acid--CoA ligase n=1 Tax=Amycolatopsis methanolica 239 TaxID=1068978 RepID=A0A076MKM5_AMYME|nr:AMP-binding protein [Amycolatopsis methanolica]AIJ21289.1 long-chain-fatty-acid--CoA ligase [Amycolatopsis methanolica 239]